jgi:2-polyprenyl-6-methoxyphenol hydroxylase-like FAD-dependent oxidoreductase
VFDVIVVGARCGGSPVAMLLARTGLRVLAIDQAKFPSERIATHMVWPPGGAALKRWGIWDAVAAENPGICHVSLSDFPGARVVSGWHAVDGVDFTFNMRRVKLDYILVQAARASGAEVREQVVLEGLVIEDGRVIGVAVRDLQSGSRFEERARMVIGADGRNSLVAKTVQAPTYQFVEPLTASYLMYVADMDKDPDMDEVYTRPPREFVLLPTDHGLTVVNVVIARHLLDEFRKDVTRSFYASYDLEPELAERVRAARPVSKVLGVTDLPNFYRKPYGEGWALVGDAGHHRDPIRAQGMHNAFQDAELLATAIDDGFNGRRDLMEALEEYERRRNERTALQYKLVLSAARFDRLSEEGLESLLGIIGNNPVAAAEWRGLVAGSMMPDEFNRRWRPDRARETARP